MGQLNLQIATRRDDNTLKAAFETPGAVCKYSIVNKLVNFLMSVGSGSELGPSGAAPTVAISVEGQAVAASGTLTVATGGSTNNQTCTIAGVTLTAKTSASLDNEFTISAVAATQATNMKNAINASPDLAGIVTASSALGVVTITAAQKGKVGNGIAISEGNLSNVTKSGALLTLGAADSSAITLSF